ncbi:MaoC family dehydratase [Nocardia sp. NPDC049190]|uniref:MaoC family dehydratase n=1 Tax=Nocardia sp. NPDC049190 TaxID=3155650 RepID=UPI0033CC3885
MLQLSFDELDDQNGVPLGATDWIEVSQSDIDSFARITRDAQWIHVDPDRAAQGPFGRTIAHGYLTLSYASHFLEELLHVDGATNVVNYGVNRVRFPAPVPSQAKLRGRGELLDVESKGAARHARIAMTIEIENGDRPACVAEVLVRYARDEG